MKKARAVAGLEFRGRSTLACIPIRLYPAVMIQQWEDSPPFRRFVPVGVVRDQEWPHGFWYSRVRYPRTGLHDVHHLWASLSPVDPPIGGSCRRFLLLLEPMAWDISSSKLILPGWNVCRSSPRAQTSIDTMTLRPWFRAVFRRRRYINHISVFCQFNYYNYVWIISVQQYFLTQRVGHWLFFSSLFWELF